MTSDQLEVAVLGPLGTYTHEAAFKLFGSDAVYNEQNSIGDVYAVLSPAIPFGVVPQENSIFGTVIETYDLLRTTSSNFIRGDVTLKVEHCLIVKQGVELHQIQKVMSHEQALGQCQEFLARNLPAASTVKTKSTAAAARELLDSPPDCAAICSSICAKLLPGLEILFTGIQNERSNFTRFYVVAYIRNASLPRFLRFNHDMKALLRINPISTDSPFDIMMSIMSQDIVIGRIDRRPSVDNVPFFSVYFLEVHARDSNNQTPQQFEVWNRQVETLVSEATSTGSKIDIIGIW